MIRPDKRYEYSGRGFSAGEYALAIVAGALLTVVGGACIALLWIVGA